MIKSTSTELLSIPFNQIEVPFAPERLAGLAIEAAEIAREIVRKNELLVETKSDGSYVTNADIAIHNFLEKVLPRLVDAIVISEEKELSPEIRRAAKIAWVIDPIDNTQALVNNNISGCGINIALIVEGEPVVGLAYYFGDNTSIIGIKGQGAFQVKDGAITPLLVEAPSGAVKFAAYRSTLDEMAGNETADMTRKLLEKASSGSPQLVYRNLLPLRLRAIVSGEADAYIEHRPLKEWDVVQAFANVGAIGGSGVSLLDGSPIRFNTETLTTQPFLLTRPGIDANAILARLKKET